ncbi:hypothetical protein ASPBRDRAFT_532748 [Aspergillus brasiliensis CBS 101740]|uniref:Uncharacterized protein n=1 Tax=Aspergillus brasiliensis (strain CBS 101740 / IMI 381727 / IBT 21946) TaxID=767769 RepID=A0A1L9U1K6_ASPBC|nr:hypothetical protein ASPBRDRAFT_532748 [Aspergillus brasiliensis CBS 101740]
MSLIADDTVFMRLWKAAQAPGDKRAVVRPWTHLLTNMISLEKTGLCSMYQPTQVDCPCQRMNITIEHFAGGDGSITSFH